MGFPSARERWYDAQDPQFRRYLDEFARGINDFAAKNPSAIGADSRVVLPVSGVDVVGHSLRAVHYGYMGSRARMNTEVSALLKNQRAAGAGRGAPATDHDELAAGSNTWAIGPGRSASGNAMLLINPHLAWGNTFYRYMQVHLVGPDYDLVGAPQVGFPVAVVGFNRHTGWGRTVNTIDTVDFYRLTVQNDQYVFDGALRSFERETRTLKVKQPDGSLRDERLDIRRSVHGPVVFDENGVTVAMRVAGLDRPKMLEQWFRMGEARSLQEFQSALRMMSVPMWHANYADDQRHIMFVFDGLVPRRRVHDFQYWSGVVPGDTSETLWTDYLSFDELPKSVDPSARMASERQRAPVADDAAAPRPHEVSRVCRAERRGAAADAHAPFAAHDHRGPEDQLRTAPREEAFDADGARRQNSPGPSQRGGEQRCRPGAGEVGPPHGRRQPRSRAVSVVRRSLLFCGKRRDGRQASRQIRPRTAARLRSWPRRCRIGGGGAVGGRRRMPAGGTARST